MILGIRGIEESSVYQDVFAKGEANGEAKGQAKGEAKGRADECVKRSFAWASENLALCMRTYARRSMPSNALTNSIACSNESWTFPRGRSCSLPPKA